jgi:hypothetical protein
MLTVNPVMKNRGKTGRNFIQCRPFSKKLKSMKYSLMEELESTLAA